MYGLWHLLKNWILHLVIQKTFIFLHSTQLSSLPNACLAYGNIIGLTGTILNTLSWDFYSQYTVLRFLFSGHLLKNWILHLVIRKTFIFLHSTQLFSSPNACLAYGNIIGLADTILNTLSWDFYSQYTVLRFLLWRHLLKNWILHLVIRKTFIFLHNTQLSSSPNACLACGNIIGFTDTILNTLSWNFYYHYCSYFSWKHVLEPWLQNERSNKILWYVNLICFLFPQTWNFSITYCTEKQQDIFNTVGYMYVVVLLDIKNSNAVAPPSPSILFSQFSNPKISLEETYPKKPIFFFKKNMGPNWLCL